jgi:AcrR family transcriptional regulator
MPRPNLSPQTRERIIAAAIALADADGPDALSIRKLGASLGRRGATLYHYFPSKDALLDTVASQIWTDVDAAVSARLARVPPGDWEGILRGTVEAGAATLGEHPRLISFLVLRPVSSPRVLQAYERMLGLLTACGWPLAFAWQAFLATENLMLSTALETGQPPFRPGPDAVRDLPLVREVSDLIKRDPSLENGSGLGLDALIAGIREAAPRT